MSQRNTLPWEQAWREPPCSVFTTLLLPNPDKTTTGYILSFCSFPGLTALSAELLGILEMLLFPVSGMGLGDLPSAASWV